MGDTAVSAPEHARSSDAELPVGTHVGDYVIESLLGKGAFGTVYKATNPIAGKSVAIKLLARKYSVDDEMIDRFVTEARAVNQIRHQNVIDIFSFGVLDDGRHYFVMEYLEGETLSARLERGPLTLAEALPILRPLARALDAAHATGIAHRDLKPDNVWLARDADGAEFPKLLDFGVAKLLGPHDALKHKTRTGAPIGTPYYMSPEQCRGRDVDHRTDFYAFGVMTYEMLTGTYPIDGEDYMSILMQQISQTPAPPSSKVPELTEATDAAVLWLMEKDPAARPPDLVTAVAALQAASRPIGVPRVSASVERAPIAAPSRGPWIALALAAAAGAGMLAFVALRRPPAATKPAPAPVVTHVEPAPPPPPPVVPTTSTITIEGTPASTRVLVAGEVIGSAPGPIVLPRRDQPVTLTFDVDGYQPASQVVTPDVDKPVVVTMKPLAKPKPGRPQGTKANPRDIQNPFGSQR